MILFLVVMIQLFHCAYYGETIGGIFRMVNMATCVFNGHYPSAKKKNNRTMVHSWGQSVLALTGLVLGLKQKKKKFHC